MTEANNFGFFTSFLSGALAGLTVDLILYPLDTVKTRLQSSTGLKASGGFSRLYVGVPSVAIGSAPGSAVFFLTYESVKRWSTPYLPNLHIAHVLAAAVGETSACLVRVPTEVIKQRSQTNASLKIRKILLSTLSRDGVAGLYRGFSATVAREIPFSAVQFSIWEYVKLRWSRKRTLTTLHTAMFGSLSGAIAGALTTPLDVAKTRLMLSLKKTGECETVLTTLNGVWHRQGISGLFSGLVPRVVWLAVGGFVFLGSYELFHNTFSRGLPIDSTLVFNTEAGSYRLESIIRGWLVREKLLPDHPVTFSDAIKEAEELRQRRQTWSTTNE